MPKYWETSINQYFDTTYKLPSPIQDLELHKQITERGRKKKVLTVDDPELKEVLAKLELKQKKATTKRKRGRPKKKERSR